MQVKRLKLRLFLEGQEVPVVSSVVNGGVDQPASAAIQIIPTDDVHHLLPRTLVHLFFLDLHPDTEVIEAFQQAEDRGYGGLTTDLLRALGTGYKLLFMGEMMSYAFQRTPGGRAVTLQCLDFSSYWDAAKQYFLTGGESSPTAKIAAFLGASERIFKEDESTTPVQHLINTLTGRSATVPQLDGLLSGVIRLLETVGGIYRGKGEKFSGLNDFFAAAELRLRLSQMFGVSPKDTTSKKLFAHREFKQWLRQLLSRNRNIVSYREVLELVLSRIYHNYVSVPAPSFRPSFEATIPIRVLVKKPLKGPLNKLVEERKKLLRDFLEAEKNQDFGKLRDLRVMIRTRAGDAAITGIGALAKAEGQKVIERTAGEDRKFQDTVSKDGPLKTTERTLAEKVLKGYEKASVSFKAGTGKAKVMERVVTHIFRPNIYFCAPPRCNVLFPDQYSSFSFQRNYMEEITRLQLSTTGEYVDDSVTPEGKKQSKYYAPNLELAKGTYVATSAKKGARFIMPHEKFTGIIPMFSDVADITAFTEIVKQQGKGRPKTPYLQNVANFNFFERRFGPRYIQLTGPFNPYVVPGLPTLIIDQYRADTFRENYGITPTAYLGLIQTVQHMVNQEGGTTALQITHARTHNEKVEFLGPLMHTFRTTVAAGKAFSLDLVSTLVPGAPIRLDDPIVGEVVKIPLRSGSDLARTPKALIGSEIKGKGTIKGLLGSHVDLVPGSSGPTQGNGEREQMIQTSYLLQKFRTVDRAVELPLDKALFPPWMSPIYSNINIGRDFYEPVIGIGSICDPVQFIEEHLNWGLEQGKKYLPDSLAAKEANSLVEKKRQELAKGFDTVKETVNMGAVDLQAEMGLGATIEQAIDELIRSYKALKEGGFEFDAFFKAYSWRPVATLTEILGTESFDPQKAGPRATGVLREEEGFHSRAFGNYDQMEHLDHPLVGLPNGKGTPRKVDPAIDPRGERWRRVQSYRVVLEADRGLLG